MKKVLFNLFIPILLSTLLWISFWFAQTNIPTNMDDYSSGLALYFAGAKPTTMKVLINKYCDAVLNQSFLWKNITWEDYYYSAKDSIFVYILCHNVSPWFDVNFNEKFNSTKEGYFKESSFSWLWIVDYTQRVDYDVCDPNSNLQYCDLTYHIPRVFNMILNDIFSIQQSRVYALTNPDFSESTVEDQIDTYAKDKFNIKFCDSTDWKYPKLCKTMETYIKASAKLIKGLEILNYTNLLKEANSSSNYYTLCKDTFWKYEFNILSCWLFGYGFNVNKMYLNLIYNEFLYYSLFVKYYNYAIINNPSLAPTQKKEDVELDKSYLKNKAYEFNREVNSSQQAISLTIKMLREMDVTFPLHVWFMMYQEDLLNLRDKSLYKIVTPFYTLYGKLRNVQTKD